jgi:hypothetical protein
MVPGLAIMPEEWQETKRRTCSSYSHPSRSIGSCCSCLPRSRHPRSTIPIHGASLLALFCPTTNVSGWSMCELLAACSHLSPNTQIPPSCRRLGLTTLAYLWQRDQGELLSEMIDAGMEAILIKVAGIGLKPMHLGKTLAEMQPLLVDLVCLSFLILGSSLTQSIRTDATVHISAAKAASTRL